jgi:hypothetical protein
MVFLAIGLRFTKEVQKETIQQNPGTDSRPATVNLFPFLVHGHAGKITSSPASGSIDSPMPMPLGLVVTFLRNMRVIGVVQNASGRGSLGCWQPPLLRFLGIPAAA